VKSIDLVLSGEVEQLPQIANRKVMAADIEQQAAITEPGIVGDVPDWAARWATAAAQATIASASACRSRGPRPAADADALRSNGEAIAFRGQFAADMRAERDELTCGDGSAPVRSRSPCCARR